MIVMPCPLGQAAVEIYQDEINAKFGSNFGMPVVYYGQLIKAKKLEEIAAK